MLTIGRAGERALQRFGSRRLHGLLLATTLALGGCGAGLPKPVLTAKGPVDTTSTTGLAARFNTSAAAGAAPAASPAQMTAMLLDGFSLIYANCSDFFESAGTAQTWVITTRDVIQTLGTVATGAVALKDGSDDTVAAIAFGSNAAYSGLDVYSRNFLFGAENIDAVRTLTLRAVSVHQQAVLAQNPSLYGEVTQALLDDQTYCSARRISALTREAIKMGNLIAVPASEAPAQIAAQADTRVMDQLGRLLELSGAASSEEAGALWWYAIRAADATDLPIIKKKLARVSPSVGPFDAAGAVKAPWGLRDRIATELRLLSPATTQSLDAWITTTRAAAVANAAAAAAGAAPLVAGAPPPPKVAEVTVPPPTILQPRPSAGRVELRVQ